MSKIQIVEVNYVAPHAGAWIETLSKIQIVEVNYVAPHAGAWIETLSKIQIVEVNYVAPHAGAWIETVVLGFPSRRGSGSPPMRGRGLKHNWKQHNMGGK
ncbi:hypothetical cytosolic protein [Syntrophus aciditrophicus SB]|uniref:Hypothetical cytosolic protein n=1 Tax=Syntrophus aciditrophicus (strain SB) TaxID=56780 RepID=Q2LWZ8_SYNAS|nr:hypothetical cytosolic protein [Syntrophus aciditrophicus SB]